MVSGAIARTGVASGHADEGARIGHIDQRLVQRIELTPHAARTAAPRVVQDVRTIDQDIFQRGDTFCIVEGAIVGNAVVKDAVAHHPGFRGDAADGLSDAQIIGNHFITRRGAGGMRTVRGALCARPGIFIPRRRRIPGAEVDPRGDDLAVVIGSQTKAIGWVIGWVAVAGAIEHGSRVMNAAVHGGELDTRASVVFTANGSVTPGCRGIDQRQAGIHLGRVSIVERYGFDARQPCQYLAAPQQ